jgi:flagellar biosynthesis protein FlhF
MSPTVKTFRAPDAASALAAVKADLGPDAVLISTRTIAGGLFRRAEVEVVAGLDAPAPRAHQAYGARPAGRPARADDEVAAELEALRRSVEATRQELARVARGGREDEPAPLPRPAAALQGRLLARGVEPVLAEELVRQALVVAGARHGGLEQAVRDLVGERLVPSRAPWLQPGPLVIALVGPTGVGKTTTLAKIAARALLEARKRVALLSVDTYRIGASEQLARYGEIMGIPALVAQDRAELLRAWQRVSLSDLVLVDTAGRSSADDVALQAALVRAIPGLQLHLVLSAASGAQQLAACAERYRALAPERLVLSKLDEAEGPGAVLSAAVRLGRPVSCVTDGQRVPEDLHSPSGPQLVDLVVPPPGAASGGA